MTDAPALDTRVGAAAERLASAVAGGTTVAPVRDLIGPHDVVSAYAVQQRLIEGRLAAGAVVVGRKIGLTAEAVREQLGVDQPDFGVLLSDMAYPDGATVPIRSVLQPRVEAEVAFVLGADLDSTSLDVAAVRAAVDHVVAAVEICGSRITDWDISLADTVADNASAGAFVLGTERRTLEQVEPREVTMELSIDGEVVSTGSGAACLGDPLHALLWLARCAAELGDPLRAGQVVLSGALGPMRPVTAGAQVVAAVSGLGQVHLRFSEDS